MFAIGRPIVAAFVPELARRYSIVQIGGDDYRSGEMMRRWEERGLRVSVFPMNDPMIVPASQLLYDTIIEQRLRHPDDPVLNQHVANAIAKHKPRGWRIAKQDDRHNIDAVISLCIAVNLHARREPPKPEPNIVWV